MRVCALRQEIVGERVCVDKRWLVRRYVLT